MEISHEAAFYETSPDGRVVCSLCPHDCRISDGGRGACGVRYNCAGKLYTLVYDSVVARTVEVVSGSWWKKGKGVIIERVG